MNRRTRAGGLLPLALPLLAVLGGFSCSEPAPPAPTAIDSSGLVTSLRPGTSPGTGVVRVEGPPRPEVRHAKVEIAIRPSTRIVARTGTGDRPMGFADLELGDRIEVVFDGAAAESVPVRAIAREIVILEKVRGFAAATPNPTPGTAPQPSPEGLPGTSPGAAPGTDPDASPAPFPPTGPAAEPSPGPLVLPGQLDPVDPPQAESPPEIPMPGSAVLRDVRTGDQATFDRVVFEFEGTTLPDAEIKVVERPIQCGSGLPVQVAGKVYLQVRLTPAQAHTEEGKPTLTNRGRKLSLPILREVRQICDFEGEVTWILGLAERREHTTMELEGPTRLVIDIPRE